MIKFISILTAFFFTANTMLWAVPPVAVSLPAPSFSSASIQIPEELGLLTQTYQGRAPGFIIHIQDAHSNLEAQNNIRNILELLSRDQKNLFVALEGASQPLAPGAYHFFRQAALNLKVADYLASKGELSGAEMYALERISPLSPGDRGRRGEGVRIEGVEDLALYNEDYEYFKKGLAAQDEVRSYFENLYAKLNQIKSRVYNPILLKFDRNVRAYQASRIELTAFVSILEKWAAKILGLELAHPVSQRDWPYLCRMLRLQMGEKSHEELSADIKRLQGSIINKVSDDSIREKLLAGLNVFDKSVTPANQNSPASQLREATALSPRKYFEALYGASVKFKFDVENYPALRNFSKRLILQSEITSLGFFDEVDRLTNQIFNRLAKTKKEKKILSLSRDVRLTEKLLKLEAVSGEWEEIKKSRVASRLLSAGLLTTDDQQLTTAVTFYTFAERRNAVLLENTLARMKQAKAGQGVLITGGFHTEGLTRMLRQKDISHVVIQPAIHTEFNNQRYQEAAAGTWKTVFDRAKIKTRIFMIHDMSGIPEAERRRQAEVEVDAIIQVLQAAFELELAENPALAENLKKLFDQICGEITQNKTLASLGVTISLVPGAGETPGQFGVLFSANGRSVQVPIRPAARITPTVQVGAAQSLGAPNLLQAVGGGIMPHRSKIRSALEQLTPADFDSILDLMLTNKLPPKNIKQAGIPILAHVLLYRSDLVETRRKKIVNVLKFLEINEDPDVARLTQSAMNVYRRPIPSKTQLPHPTARSLGADVPEGLCVTGDTLLPVLRSSVRLVPIKSVRPGDQVLSLNESTREIEPHRINALLDMSVKPVFRLTTASGRSIKTTANHPYLVRRGAMNEWAKVSELRVGESIAVPKETPGLLLRSGLEEVNESVSFCHAGLNTTKLNSQLTFQEKLTKYSSFFFSFIWKQYQAYKNTERKAKIYSQTNCP
ncbi:MAG: hypothetical protein HY586_00125 [Candidatus Omnitrophica bacterium]|nr:hypothetical protein [Candidatus Omnitrophota bacterium]